MRKVRLVCVGNIKDSYFAAAMTEYSKRLARFCDFSVIETAEFTGPNGLEREAEQILKQVAGTVILFGLGGQMPTSEEFSTLMERSYINFDTITFIIGGSDGVSERVRKSASHEVSFGKVTYPHRLMRVIATEQIYRAFTIQNNLPYHK